MTGQKTSIEDILQEYSDEQNSANNTTEGRLETEKLLNSAEKLSSRKSAEEIINEHDSRRTLRKHSQPAADPNLRRSEPADDVKPGEVKSNPQVSFVNSEAMNNFRSAEVKISDTMVPLPQDPIDAAPKIRRMADSTRAKEAEKSKKKNKRRKKDDNGFTYEKETPDGEYMYTPPKVKKKKRTRSVREEAENPENKRYNTDIVPSPAQLEAARPVIPAPRAKITSIDLSSPSDLDENSIDVHISQKSEEFQSMSYKKKRTKRIVDFNYYGDVEDVGRDIFELKSIIGVRVFILALTSFMSIYMALANQFSKIPIIDLLNQSVNSYFYLFAHLALGLISIFSAFSVVSSGINKFISLKADNDSIAAISAVGCMLAILPALFAPELIASNTIHIYMPVGNLALMLNALGKLLIVKRAHKNFKFISQDTERYGVTYVRDEEKAEVLTRGTLGDFPILASMRKTEFLMDFLRYSYSSDATDSYCRKASPLCLGFSVIVAIFMTFFRMGTVSVDSIAFGFSIFSMLISASACIALPLVSNIPLWNVSNRIYKNHGVMLGYQSVDDYYDTNSILIDAKRLFPHGSVKLSGIKIFANYKAEEVLLQAASLTHHAGSIMKNLFAEVIAERGESGLYNIENFEYEEEMGLCGWIANRRILFGNREFMLSHNIEGIPAKAKEDEYCKENQEALYLSISGNLAALFSVEISANREVKEWMGRLAKKKMCVIIKSVDTCLTLKRLSELFNVPENTMRLIPKKLHESFESETQRTIKLSSSMACTGKFSTLVQLLLGTKVVHSATMLGLIVQTVSVLLGLGLCGMLLIAKGFDDAYVSSSALVIYNLICTAVTCIAVSLKRL